MGNEQADHECQQAQRSQVEVKAVGQALQITVVATGLQHKLGGDVGRQRSGLLFEQQTRQLSWRAEQRLRVADIDHDHPRRQFRLQDQRRHQLTIAGARALTRLQVQLA
ncbi:hypothetical protein PS623_00456 [Pseudomonas fluorescens]|nr:hypothetical protein PS623_00456 [Pseudomonas fluorescens]